MCNTPVEVQFMTSAGCLNYPCRTPLLDLCAIPITLAQQDGGRRIPVRNGFDIHGLHISNINLTIKNNISIYMATFRWPFSGNAPKFKPLLIWKEGSSG